MARDGSRPKTAAIALLGFSLASIPRGQAWASSTGSSSVGSTGTDSTSDSTTSATAITFTATGVTAIVAGVVILAILVSTDPNEARDQRARALLDVGLLAARGDLGAEMALLVRSPQAHDQLADELARGEGPGCSALVHATGCSPQLLAERWQQTAEAHGLITDQAGAMRFSMDFVSRIAPSLVVSDAQQRALLGRLQRERIDPAFPASAPTHAWLARWLGVPVEAIAAATSPEAQASAACAEAQGASASHEQITRCLDAIAGQVGVQHAEQITARIDHLIARASQWLPEGTPAVAALDGP